MADNPATREGALWPCYPYEARVAWWDLQAYIFGDPPAATCFLYDLWKAYYATLYGDLFAEWLDTTIRAARVSGLPFDPPFDCLQFVKPLVWADFVQGDVFFGWEDRMCCEFVHLPGMVGAAGQIYPDEDTCERKTWGRLKFTG